MRKLLLAVLLTVYPAIVSAMEPLPVHPIMPSPFFDLVCAGATTSCALLNQTLSGTTVVPTGSRFLIPRGSATAPPIAFQADEDGTPTGIFSASADNVSVTTNGVQSWQINNLGHLTPQASNARDLGATSQAVRDAFLGRSIQSSTTKTLVETSATAFVSVAVANSTAIAGRIVYTIRASDATDTQGLSGEAFFSCVATAAGAVTCAALSDQHILNPVSAGTLTNTTTQATAANLVTFSANATSSLTQTTLRIDFRVELMGNAAAVTGL